MVVASLFLVVRAGAPLASSDALVPSSFLLRAMKVKRSVLLRMSDAKGGE